MPSSQVPLVFDGRAMRLEDVVAVSCRLRPVELGTSAQFRHRITRGAQVVSELLATQGSMYGVTTGYGDSVTTTIPPSLVEELGRNLYTYHGVGLGLPFGLEETRAILAARLQSLTQGWSGVTLELLTQLTRLLQEDVLPVIPSEGSVGASGDLTPLSYVAAVLCGERSVWLEGRCVPTAQAFAHRRLRPISLRPKEGLAVMNGTAVMTGLACLAWHRAEYLEALASKLTAGASVALKGNAEHFDEALFSAKPHRGPQVVAARIRSDLAGSLSSAEPRLQDRYSIRCAPHVIGVLEEALPWLRQLIENELNSANDNPLVDPETGRILHGGNFYGGHVALAMDTLKNVVANLADLMDRQLALLVDPRFSHGLATNLSGASGPRASINHGLKALQIAASAWTAEALKLTMPASVFSRSTECHNQDKVSLGTISARDALRVLELTEQVAAALALGCHQALALRQREDMALPPAVDAFARSLGLEFVDEDRALDGELRDLLRDMRTRKWDLYS